MQIKEITSSESKKENLEAWCFEVGSRFEQYSKDSVKEFNNILKIKKIKNKNIIDLGCGDGAASNEFYELGYNVISVDINEEKLRKVRCGPIVKKMGMLEFLEETIWYGHHVFSHHSLEHTVEAPKILHTIGDRIAPGCLFYAAVPAEDYLHSVHHVVFESPEELLPHGMGKILLKQRERFEEKEFICIAQKNIDYMDPRLLSK